MVLFCGGGCCWHWHWEWQRHGRWDSHGWRFLTSGVLCPVLWKPGLSAVRLRFVDDFHSQRFHKTKFSPTYSSGSEIDVWQGQRMQMRAMEELLSQDYKHLFCEDVLRVLTKQAGRMLPPRQDLLTKYVLVNHKKKYSIQVCMQVSLWQYPGHKSLWLVWQSCEATRILQHSWLDSRGQRPFKGCRL